MRDHPGETQPTLGIRLLPIAGQTSTGPARRRPRRPAPFAWLLLVALWVLSGQAAAFGPDNDSDGIPNTDDNCINTWNPDQTDDDHDGDGNICDNCPTAYNPRQENADGDSDGNVCDTTPGTNDRDQDGLIDTQDNCPLIANPNQDDFDEDGAGDLCDADIVIRQITSHDGTESFVPYNGAIIPARYFSPTGEIKVRIMPVPNLGGFPSYSLPLGTDPEDYEVGVGGSYYLFGTYSYSLPAGPSYTFDGYSLVIPQQVGANVKPDDAHIRLTASIRRVNPGGGPVNPNPLRDIVTLDLIDGRDLAQAANTANSDYLLSTQITPNGLDVLEQTFLDAQIYPSEDDFNAQMTVDIPHVDYIKEAALSESFCKPLSDWAIFKRTPSWDEVLVLAATQFAAYDTLERGICSDVSQAAACAGTVLAIIAGTPFAAMAAVEICAMCTIAEQTCVKSAPTVADFEVCVDSLEGELKLQQIDRIVDTDLYIPENQSSQIALDVQLENLLSLVDLRLSDVRIRYTGGGQNCVARPTNEVSAEELDADPQLIEETTCKDAQVSADLVCSTCTPDLPNSPVEISQPEIFTLGISAVDAEKLSFTSVIPTSLKLVDLNELVPPGLCTETTSLQLDATQLLTEFHEEARALITHTWNSDWTDKTRAVHLRELLQPLNTGVEPSDFANDKLEFTEATVSSLHGISLKQSTQVDPGALNTKPASPTLYTGFVIDVPPQYDNGTSDLGDFDVQYSINTLYLNQRIATQARQLLEMDLVPTYTELGIAPPAGIDAGEPASMLATKLAAWNPLLGEIGAKTLHLYSTVTVQPFAWMPLDYPSPQAPLYFAAPRLTITIEDEDGRIWVKVIATLSNGYFPLLDGSDNNNREDVSVGGTWEYQVEGTLGFAGCSYAQYAASNGTLACAEQLVNDLASVFEPRFDRALDEFLAMINIPAYYPQAGDSRLPTAAAPMTPLTHESAVGYYSMLARFGYELGDDSDGDTVYDIRDNCPTVPNQNQRDTDADGLGDACDNDDDNDGIDDAIDLCQLIASDQANADGDKFGDQCDPDADNDGIPNATDNCPLVVNPDQKDADNDGVGNACDNDLDNDGIDDAVDNCPSIANRYQENLDRDNLGDACDDDLDGDGVVNASDNCPENNNANQLDYDRDGGGNQCDIDFDNDLITNAADNCPYLPNYGQEDLNGNGIGDYCEDPTTADSDGDGFVDANDDFPYFNVAIRDTDGDGKPDQILPSCNAACLADFGLEEDLDDDDDGLRDTVEENKGTDPLKKDTDGDGYEDGFEVGNGFDPRDPNSNPDQVPNQEQVPLPTWAWLVLLLGVLRIAFRHTAK